MEDGRIPDENITASSFYQSPKAKEKTRPSNGRLNKKKTEDDAAGWSASSKKEGEYIQVDLGAIKVITMVATQGRGDFPQWVTTYSLSYSLDNKDWKDYDEDSVKVFPGNSDQQTVVTNVLQVPIETRHIRLIVKGYRAWPSLRMELYGC
ncbi:Lactadherin [Exaiptasia diaphana]|nr:Lactadherin [Exaiptasia diaphana]KXJ25357.1 Lactadherin [Exaiptasia diaphana]